MHKPSGMAGGRTVNKHNVRRWLAKALDDPLWNQVKAAPAGRQCAEGTVAVRTLPEWACMLHSHGAWRFLSYSQVRQVHNSAKLQRALTAAYRLGGEEAARRVLLEGLELADNETPSAWLGAATLQPKETRR